MKGEMLEIAICVVCYNRCRSVERLLDNLNIAKYLHPVKLIISVDKSDKKDVADYAKQFVWAHGDKIVVDHKENLGLRKHVLRCGEYINDYSLDALIVLEDDITVSPYFFQYAEACVAKYKNDDRIAGISLYGFSFNYQTYTPFNPMRSQYDVYMMNCAMSWGQVWMKRQWNDFVSWYNYNSDDFNLPYLPQAINGWKASSWLKYHTRYCIENNKFFIFPYQSLSTNNGDAGVHQKQDNPNYFQTFLQCQEKVSYQLPTYEECEVKYDGFFEPLFLEKYLGLEQNSLLVDYFGKRTFFEAHRYVLSVQSLPYKIIKSFALDLRPFEANIIFDIKGDVLKLYDLSSKAELIKSEGQEKLIFNYQYFNAFVRSLHIWGIKGVLGTFYRVGISKLSKHFSL